MDIDLKEIAVYIVLIILVLIAAQHLNVVVSGSMEPVNLLGLQEFNPDEVEVGDIVVYNAAWHDGPVIHRVIEKGQINSTTVFKIKGDNNDVADPYWVTESQITSRVLTFNGQPVIIPKIGYISIWIRGL